MGDIAINVRLLPIVITAVVTFLLGGAWYTALFGKAWVKAQGFTDEQVKALEAARSPAVFFGVMLASYLVSAGALAMLISMGGVVGASQGALFAFFVWIVVAAIKMTDHIATGKQMAGYFIDTSFQLLFLVATGAVLAAWQ